MHDSRVFLHARISSAVYNFATHFTEHAINALGFNTSHQRQKKLNSKTVIQMLLERCKIIIS